MYWGNPDASVRFCEDKYNVLPYVAEYYNTMSAISYLIVGLILKNFTKLKKISNSILFLGVGTMLLHGTLRKYGQWVDECGMLSFSYDVIVELRRRKNKTTNYLYFVALIGSYFMLIKFHFFVLLFLGLQLYIYVLSNKSYKNRIIQMGESKKNVFCTGSPTIDFIKSLKFYDRKYLSNFLNS